MPEEENQRKLKNEVSLVKNILLNVVGFAIGIVVWAVMTHVLSFLAGLLLGIPILGRILYWPVDSMWAATVIVNCGSVGAGGSVAAAICSRVTGVRWGQKLFCLCIIGMGIILTAITLFDGTFSWGEFGAFVLSAIAAGFFWKDKE